MLLLAVEEGNHSLDSIKNRISRGCASFSCFSCGVGPSASAAGLDATTTTTTTACPPLKVEPVKHPVVSTTTPDTVDTITKTTSCPVKVVSSSPESVAAVPEKLKGQDNDADVVDNTGKVAFKLSLRSSLKRPTTSVVVESRSLFEDIKENETLSVDDDASELTSGGDTGRRKVKWPDACGSELTHVREFEPSEMGLSDEEWEMGRQKGTCSCVIM
ncbi:unnamed protein product [Eruca vesicaria subsp. sativa]|uniref:Uncharacterized protein n=1 Tax=Eruca vesicaria subsp. sativa TaxID=29727 RepID=A0ABC8M8W5_ERUVS|nr:unnamed protein product [Eruca vesicaria subsp. sativa]